MHEKKPFVNWIARGEVYTSLMECIPNEIKDMHLTKIELDI